MGLRLQLALVGLVTLMLPWAGCQYLRETEQALRQGQQTMLLDTGRSIAALLADRPALFPDAGSIADAWTLYAHAVTGMPVLDGYADDWVISGGADEVVVDERLSLLIGRTERHLYLFLDVTAPGDAAGKRIEIALGEATPVYRFGPVAPGPLPAMVRRPDGSEAAELRIQGWWTPTTDGFNLEARIPGELVGRRLGIRVLQSGPVTEEVIAATHPPGRPGRLAAPSPGLGAVMAGYARPGLELHVTDAEGWQLSGVGTLAVGPSPERPSAIARVYRRLLAEPVPTLPDESSTGKIVLPWVDGALAGEAGSVWRRLPGNGQAVVSAAIPILAERGVIGALVMKQSSAPVQTLTNRALTRLTSLTLIATLAVAGALLGYATWLSLRITRLSRAADRAIGTGGQISTRLPSAGAADELGDLARSFSRLLGRVQETNDYLRTLGARLSHELRTPLAVVTSSLDNLESVGLSPEQSDYAHRARDGSLRLQGILNAMSEASRTEQAVTGAEIEHFDLATVVASATEGYASAYPEREFRLHREVDSASVAGVPELVVQMLDKLIANAVEFSDEGAVIDIRLAIAGDRTVLSVANPGPPLPDSLRERLFDSLVSVRRSGSASHLGLGLYIARLIAESHGGRIRAANLPDHSGVEFCVEIPLSTPING